MKSLEQKFQQWEELIRTGRGGDVVADLTLLKPEDVPTNLKHYVANFSRRVGQYGFGLRFLREDYLQMRENPVQAEALVIEYGALLTEVGAAGVAEKILWSISEPTYHFAHLYRAYLRIKKWDYKNAPADIQEFLKHTDDAYFRDVANVNLSACYTVLDRPDLAHEVLIQLEQRKDQLPPMLLGALVEQRGQVLFLKKQWAEARAHFQSSFDLVKGTGNALAVYCEKWILILDLYEKPWNVVESHWNDFSERVIKMGYWEVLRELDRHLAIKDQREDLLAKIYFGTPFQSYREILSHYCKWTPPASFVYPIQKDPPQFIFDLGTQTLSKNDKKIPLSKLFAKLLVGLTRDLYRPAAIGSLFDLIYEKEFFHPEFAYNRIHQLLHRFKKFVQDEKLPIEIQSSELGATLIAKEGFAVRYSAGAADVAAVEVVRKNFGYDSFTSQDFAEVSKISQRTCLRVLLNEVNNGRILKIGRGSGTLYRLNPSYLPPSR